MRPFTDKQIALLETFADQAVIAIENVRLFNETKEALEQQTATAEILRAISSSPTDTQPVFETIARLAVDVCDGRHCTVYRFDGERVHLVAHHNIPAEVRPEFERTYPLPIESDTQAARSIRERAVVHSPDTLNDASVSEWVRRTAQVGGYRSESWSRCSAWALRSEPSGSRALARTARPGRSRTRRSRCSRRSPTRP